VKKPLPENRCTASRLCKRPAFEVEGLPRPVCLRHAVKQGQSRFGVVRTKGGRSKSEADRAVMLALAEKAGEIRKLDREVKYELRLDGMRVVLEGGKLIEALYMDFVYERRCARGKWEVVYEDHKNGLFTESYLRHKKWFEEIYGPIFESGTGGKRG
jgi:hypothetical protein